MHQHAVVTVVQFCDSFPFPEQPKEKGMIFLNKLFYFEPKSSATVFSYI